MAKGFQFVEAPVSAEAIAVNEATCKEKEAAVRKEEQDDNRVVHLEMELIANMAGQPSRANGPQHLFDRIDQ